MSDTPMPKWVSLGLTALLGTGAGGAGLAGVDLFGAEAREFEREAFLNQIIFCNEIRTEAREVALRMLETQRQECREDLTKLLDRIP